MPLPPAVPLRKRIHTRSIVIEGARGCSHLTELLLGLPATAIQTFASEMRDTDGHESPTIHFLCSRKTNENP